VYHVELRQFPHNMCRFNLSAAELRTTILVPWAQERWVEFGERKWSPHQATLTVLEGPRIPFGQLTMGRGWRTAQRSGREVTEELLAAVKAAAEREASASSTPPSPAARPQMLANEGDVEDLAADSLGLELLAQLAGEPAPLRRVWELAAERNPDSPASATLALAERAVESLLRARLVELVRVERAGEDAVALDGEQALQLVRALAGWGEPGPGRAVSLRRT
jgi:hypothetical protein